MFSEPRSEHQFARRALICEIDPEMLFRSWKVFKVYWVIVMNRVFVVIYKAEPEAATLLPGMECVGGLSCTKQSNVGLDSPLNQDNSTGR